MVLYTQISHNHISINVFYHAILDYPMASESIIDEKIKNLCCLLWTFETRIAITIMTNQHQHHDCEEGIMMFDIIKIIAQLYPLAYNLFQAAVSNTFIIIVPQCQTNS